jgi:hypothetical protein
MFRHLAITVGLVVAAVPLAAQHQWRLGIEVGATTFSPAVHDTSSPTVYLRPWHPTSYALRLTRTGEKIGYGIGMSLFNGPVGANIEDFVMLQGPKVGGFELAPEVRWRFARTGTGATFELGGGPVWTLYATDGYDPVSRFGGQGALTLSLPLGDAFRVDLRGDLTGTGTIAPDDTETDEVRHEDVMWRGRLALGLSTRL